MSVVLPLLSSTAAAHVTHYALAVVGVVGFTALVTPRLLVGPAAPDTSATARLLLPLGVVSSAAAAGVHLAVGPAHAGEPPLVLTFFPVSAALKLLWAWAVAVRCTRRLLVAGLVGNLVVVGLWLVTRTWGLPSGLLPEAEAVGPWDVAAGAWELVVVVSSAVALAARGPVPRRPARWRSWHPVLPAYVAASVVVLVGLSLSGAGA